MTSCNTGSSSCYTNNLMLAISKSAIDQSIYGSVSFRISFTFSFPSVHPIERLKFSILYQRIQSSTIEDWLNPLLQRIGQSSSIKSMVRSYVLMRAKLLSWRIFGSEREKCPNCCGMSRSRRSRSTYQQRILRHSNTIGPSGNYLFPYYTFMVEGPMELVEVAEEQHRHVPQTIAVGFTVRIALHEGIVR